MDAGPDDTVRLTCRNARSHQESQLALEGKNEQAQALYSFGSPRQVRRSTRARVPRAVRQVPGLESVLYHDHKRACVAVKALQLHLVVLVPAHAPGRHLTRPRPVLFLADHAFVEVSLIVFGLLGVEVTLDALLVE